MALTKVRSPVTDIDLMSSGTTLLQILSAGGDIDVNVAGVDIMDISSTAVVVDPAITLDADLIEGESVSLATAAGAAGTLMTAGALMSLITSSAHPLVLGSNSLQNLIAQIDGTVTLAVAGSSATDLIDKDYVDTAIAATGAETGFDATLATDGHITIPTNSGGNDLIFNWGVTASVNKSASPLTVTFNEPFLTAFLSGGVSRSIASSNAQEGVNFANAGLTTMDLYPTYTAASVLHWYAIGY